MAHTTDTHRHSTCEPHYEVLEKELERSDLKTKDRERVWRVINQTVYFSNEIISPGTCTTTNHNSHAQQPRCQLAYGTRTRRVPDWVVGKGHEGHE